MTHARACPVCGLVVEWTRGEKVPATMPDGSIAMVTPMSLSCPEHGPFDNMKAKMNEAWKRVERGMKEAH